MWQKGWGSYNRDHWEICNVRSGEEKRSIMQCLLKLSCVISRERHNSNDTLHSIPLPDPRFMLWVPHIKKPFQTDSSSQEDLIALYYGHPSKMKNRIAQFFPLVCRKGQSFFIIIDDTGGGWLMPYHHNRSASVVTPLVYKASSDVPSFSSSHLSVCSYFFQWYISSL